MSQAEIPEGFESLDLSLLPNPGRLARFAALVESATNGVSQEIAKGSAVFRRLLSAQKARPEESASEEDHSARPPISSWSPEQTKSFRELARAVRKEVEKARQTELPNPEINAGRIEKPLCDWGPKVAFSQPKRIRQFCDWLADGGLRGPGANAEERQDCDAISQTCAAEATRWAMARWIERERHLTPDLALALCENDGELCFESVAAAESIFCRMVVDAAATHERAMCAVLAGVRVQINGRREQEMNRDIQRAARGQPADERAQNPHILGLERMKTARLAAWGSSDSPVNDRVSPAFEAVWREVSQASQDPQWDVSRKIFAAAHALSERANDGLSGLERKTQSPFGYWGAHNALRLTLARRWTRRLIAEGREGVAVALWVAEAAQSVPMALRRNNVMGNSHKGFAPGSDFGCFGAGSSGWRSAGHALEGVLSREGQRRGMEGMVAVHQRLGWTMGSETLVGLDDFCWKMFEAAWGEEDAARAWPQEREGRVAALAQSIVLREEIQRGKRASGRARVAQGEDGRSEETAKESTPERVARRL